MREAELGLRGVEVPRRRWRWALSLRGLMVLVLVVGGLVGWYVRQARVRREALATIKAIGGSVSFVDQRPDSSGWWVWCYRRTGDDSLREVDQVDLMPQPRSPALQATAATESWWDQACAAIARLGRIERVNLFDAAITARGLAHLEESQVVGLGLFSSQPMSEATLAQVRRLRNLRGLLISVAAKAGLPRSVVPVVAGLTQLEELELFGLADLRGDELAPLGAIGHLKRISIAAAPVSEDCLDRLGPLDQLTSLAFERTRLTDAGLRRLVARAPRLRSIAVDGSLLTDGGIEALARLPDLEIVALANPPAQLGRLTDASLATLGRLRSLRFLFLNGGRFTDVGLDALRGLPLDRLDLGSIEASEAGLARLVAGRTFLYLGLHGPGVTDALLPHLPGHLGGSSTLDLSRSRVGDAGMPHLAALRVRGLLLNDTPLTDAGLATLAAGATCRLLMAQDTPVTPAGAAAYRAAHPGTTLSTGPSQEAEN